MRVLIVEDNRDAGDLFAELLQGLGHDARAVTSGSAVLDLVEGGTLQGLDLVFVDVNLPDINGIALVERLRERLAPLGAGALPRFVAVSGLRDSDVDEMGGSTVFDSYLQKPVDFEQLEALLATAQERREPSPEAGSPARGGQP